MPKNNDGFMRMLMNVMSEIMTKDDILRKMKDEIEDYLTEPTKDKYDIICIDAQLLLTKDIKERMGDDEFNKLQDDLRDSMDLFSKHKDATKQN